MDDRVVERRALFGLWLANIVAGLVQCQVYLGHAPDAIGALAWLFLLVAMLAAIAWSSGVIAALGWVASRLGLHGRAFVLLNATLFTAYQVALYMDARAYDLFRYHLNAWVWAVLTTEGVTDSIDLDRSFWLGVVGVIVGTLVSMYVIQRWQTARLRRSPTRFGRPRPVWIVLAIVVLPLIIDKSLYASANLLNAREITSVARLVPLYTRFTVRRAAQDWLDLKIGRPAAADHGRPLLMHYPIERPRIRADGPRPNVLIILVESLRADMLSPQVMPFTWQFAQGGRRFVNHASGGSASRYGSFTLLYGLHGSYFGPVYAEHTSPALVDALMDLGYEFRIYGTAPMTFPELRSTAWVRVPQFVEDGLQPAPGESRDAELVRRFTSWVDHRGHDRPFFSFAFLDAPHFHYHVVDGRTPFEPYAGSLDRAVLSSESARRIGPLLFNRYRNAVFDVDHSVRQMIEALARSGELDNTLVVITGDHGEEFFEHGFWGHTANFTPTQVMVPMVMRGPGVTRGVETSPTSHVDLAPTILELLGADPAQRAGWTVGENMLSPAAHRDRVVAGWDVVAAWTDDGIVVIPLDPYRGLPEAYDFDWKPIGDMDAELRRAAPELRMLAESTRRFLR